MEIIVGHTPARRALAGAVVLVLVAACAGAGGGGGGGGGGTQTAAAVAGGELALSGPGVDAYGATPPGACRGSAVFTLVMNELTDAAQRAGRPAPELDPRLCGIAETFLGWDSAKNGPPRPAVLSFVSHRFGLPITVTPPTLAEIGPLPASPSAEPENHRQISERIVQAVGDAVINAVRPRLGMALQRVRKGRNDVSYRISVALADVPIELDPLPRRLDLGQKATLSGRLLAGVKDPKVFVSDPVGQLSAPEQAPGDAFKAEVACGDRPGQIQIEIRGEYDGGTAVVAAFPVACGEALPTSVAVAGPAWPTAPEAAEGRILELVNAARTQAGLKPLQADAALAGVARGIASDLAARAGAPGGPGVAERLKQEGIASPLVLQSAAAERTVERAHERLLASPSNRANLLNPDVTHAGIGLKQATDDQGRPIVYVTEVFIRELPKADVEQTRQALRDAVARKRKDARTNAVAPDPTLDGVAQKYAEALAAAGGTLPKEQASQLTAPLNKAFTRVTMVSGAKQEPLDFAEEPQTTAPGKTLGVGVATGKHPVLGRNATYVVLMVGTPRR